MFAQSPHVNGLRLEMHFVAFKALQPGQLLPFCQAFSFVSCRGMTVMQFSRAAVSDIAAAAHREHSGSVMEVQILVKCVLEV